MEATLQPPTFTATRGVLFAAAVFLAPALALWHLHGHWNPDGSYAYGWAVPLLAAFLCKSRWDDRPAPSSPADDAIFLVIFFALVTLPALWLQEAAPERSICAWSYAVACIGISLSLISLVGGLAWLRWFIFPFGFILTAVPWPHTLEMLLSNFLMRGTAGVTVEILCLIGFPSVQSGNLVHLETGVIDIDEACSGIRSLQAMVMISLFLGELFRLKLAQRLLLMVIGLSVTLLANVLRTVTLSSIAFNQGMSAVDRYHDTAGLVVLIFSLSSTLLAAFLLRPRKSAEPTQESAFLSTATGVDLTLPRNLGVALLLWFLVEEIAVEAWYRRREPKWQGWSWSVQWPEHSEGFHFITIPERSRRLLMCDDSRAAAWKEPDGSDWSLYWIRWNPGNPSAEVAKVHRPDVCLNAEGAVMERDTGMHVNLIGGTPLPFHSYTFAMGGKTLYVFFCLYEEIPGQQLALTSTPQFEEVDMFQRALKGRRNIGQQSLEFALSGYRSERSAQQAFKARLEQLMQTGQNSVPVAGQ